MTFSFQVLSIIQIRKKIDWAMLCLRCNPNPNPNQCIAAKCPEVKKHLYAHLSLCFILDCRCFKNYFYYFDSKACEHVCKVFGKYVERFPIYRLCAKLTLPGPKYA